eukprot:g32618.t1
MAKSPPGLLFLDPDVETSAEDFARDWRSLEAMKPQLVAIYNTNLPGGAGWILNRLLALGTYEEIAAGSNDGGAGERDPLRQLRAWSLLLRRDAPGDTNPRRCLADFDPLVAARQLRVPCFLSCEGPGFDERWGAFRRKVLQNAQQGYALDEDLLLEAVARNRGIVENDEILIHGRSRFVSRLRHEYTHDSHLEGFCLFGITAAAFIKGRHMLGMEPVEVQTHGKRFFPPRLGLGEMDVAYTMVTDSETCTGGIEFSFLENSGWAVSLEDIITNLAMQKSHLGAPFELYERTWPPLDLQPAGLMAVEDSGRNLRHFGQSQVAQSYLMAVRMLLLGREQLSFLAEGRFLAEQIHYQVGVRVSWAPPLALYTPGAALSSTRSGTRRAVVLRSRFFVSLMGELLRSLLREVVALNVEQYPLEVIFLGKDKQFEEQWLSLKQLADFDLAILWPNDLHQRTFHEVYRMAMPLLMPDAEGLFRAQKMCNWGYASYGARLAQLPESTHPFEPWWNSWSSSPQLVSYWERFSDWQQMPHVQRFASLPGLVVLSLQLDLEQITAEMSDFHRRLCEQTLGLELHEGEKVQRQHRHRFEDTSSKAPLYKGTLFKLNTDGNADEPAHWLKRDMWVACDGSLCYFSIKENKRLDDHEQDICMCFSAESEAEYQKWRSLLSQATNLDGAMQTIRLGGVVADELKQFRLAVKNRRMKVKAEGDRKKAEDWFEREMWIAKNGSLVYWSKKEDRELVYYTADDIANAKFIFLEKDDATHPWAFQVQLAPNSGVEFAPGEFAAESEALRDRWISEMTKKESVFESQIEVLLLLARQQLDIRDVKDQAKRLESPVETLEVARIGRAVSLDLTEGPAPSRARALVTFHARVKGGICCDAATQTAPAITLSKMYGGIVPHYIQRELARLRQENQLLRYKIASVAMSQPKRSAVRHQATQTAPALTFSTEVDPYEHSQRDNERVPDSL